MTRTYHTHPYYTSATRILSRFFLTLILLAWAIPLLTGRMLPGLISFPFRGVLFLSITLGLTWVLLFSLLRDKRKTALILSDETLTKKNSIGSHTLHYSEVTAFRFTSVAGLFPAAEMRTHTGKMSIPLSIENLPEAVTIIRERLGTFGRDHSISHHDIERFRLHALLHEHGGHRLFLMLNPLLILCCAAFTFGLMVAVFFWDLDIRRSLLFGLMSMFFPVLTALYADYRIVRVMKSGLMQQGEVPEIDELALHRSSILIMSCAYMILGIFIRAVSRGVVGK